MRDLGRRSHSLPVHGRALLSPAMAIMMCTLATTSSLKHTAAPQSSSGNIIQINGSELVMAVHLSNCEFHTNERRSVRYWPETVPHGIEFPPARTKKSIPLRFCRPIRQSGTARLSASRSPTFASCGRMKSRFSWNHLMSTRPSRCASRSSLSGGQCWPRTKAILLISLLVVPLPRASRRTFHASHVCQSKRQFAPGPASSPALKVHIASFLVRFLVRQTWD
jgi:hypothetical protein